VHATAQMAEQGRFSRVELRGHALASRQAKKQLLQVPWNRFRKAYEEYPQWLGLSLWIRAVVAAKGYASTELLKTLRERCPGFLESEESIRESNLLAFHLLEWVHSRIFVHAKRQGWLDALTFYGVRHLHSQAVWAYWEQCEIERGRVSPKTVPSFEEWRQRALETKISGEVTYSNLALAVEKYIDGEAMALWVHPLLAPSIKLPRHVVSELERRLPHDSHHRSISAKRGARGHVNWRFVIRAANLLRLGDAKAEGCFDDLVESLRSHPRYVRLMIYGRYWAKVQARDQLERFPTFRQWGIAAERYVEARRP
jgi:hypothetical protein